MKKLLLVASAAFLTGVLCLIWAQHQWTGPGPAAPADLVGEQITQVRIPAGMSLSVAADTLVARGLLRNRRVMLVGARATGLDRGLRAGLYELAYGQSPRDLLTDLTSGLSVQVVLTIPEGLDSIEISELVAAATGISARRFLTVADSLARQAVGDHRMLGPSVSVAFFDSLLRASSGVGGVRKFYWCEGLLAPDTYHLAEGAEPRAVATVLLETQLERLHLAVDAGEGGPNADLAPLALLTLASVVETEARRDDERALIAAVYTNRLQRNWRLEADPTVAFVLNKKGKRLFYKDLKVDSPYNTYRQKGLPPGPIGTPGLASLLAAAQPDSACEAMYFVSDGKDRHVFSRTAREHEAAVQKFRAARSQARQGD
jgi:UPF0755 protein